MNCPQKVRQLSGDSFIKRPSGKSQQKALELFAAGVLSKTVAKKLRIARSHAWHCMSWFDENDLRRLDLS